MPAIAMTTTLAEAIAAMKQGTHDYNRGVLATLGLETLGTVHAIACHRSAKIADQRIAHGSGGLDAVFETTPYDAAQDEANAERDAAWAPIQAIIDQARAYLDGAPDAAPAFGEHV